MRSVKKIRFEKKRNQYQSTPDRLSLSSKLEEEDAFFRFWHHHNLSGKHAIDVIHRVASVSNNLSWIFLAAYQCAIHYSFKQQNLRSLTSLAVTEKKEKKVLATYNKHLEELKLSGVKSWLVSVNVKEILVFVKLEEPISLPGNKERKSLLVLVTPEKTVKFVSAKNKKFLTGLNQGSVEFRLTKIKKENLFSSRDIKNFRRNERYFVMLTVTVFLFVKVKSPRLKKMYFNLAKQLMLLLYRRQITSSKVEGFAAVFRRYFKMFEKLPERRRINNWENDKKLFKAITS